jgi:hypothetical protein
MNAERAEEDLYALGAWVARLAQRMTFLAVALAFLATVAGAGTIILANQQAAAQILTLRGDAMETLQRGWHETMDDRDTRFWLERFVYFNEEWMRQGKPAASDPVVTLMDREACNDADRILGSERLMLFLYADATPGAGARSKWDVIQRACAFRASMIGALNELESVADTQMAAERKRQEFSDDILKMYGPILLVRYQQLRPLSERFQTARYPQDSWAVLSEFYQQHRPR